MKLSTSSRVLAVLLASGLALGTGLYACGGSASKGPVGAETAEESADGAVGEAALVKGEQAAKVARAFRIGLHRGYRLSTSTTTVLGEGQSITLGVQGDLDVSYADATDRGERFRFALRNAKLTAGSAQGFDPERAREVEVDLQKPFFVTLSRAGHVVELQVPRESTSVVSGLRKHVATLLQYEVSAQDRWETSEHDTTGVYHATYEQNGSETVRLKDRYAQMLTAKGLVEANAQVQQTVAGRATLALDGDRWPSKLTVLERTITKSGAGLRDIVSQRTDSLELTNASDDRGALGSAMREAQDYETVSLESLELFVAQQHNADLAMVRGRSLPTLLTTLDDKDEQVSLEASAALTAYLRLHPEESAKLAARMRNYDYGAKRIFGALSAAGTPESQEVLADVLRDGKAHKDAREDAAIALSMSENPQHESLDAVRRAMHDRDPEVASASTLAAGNLARQLAENDPDTAKDVVGDLLGRLDRAAGVDEQVLLLRALGNSGDLRVLPYAERFLQSSVDVVRAASCDSLTFVKSEAADNMLVRALSRDDSEVVRGSAVRVSAQRPFEAYFAPLARVLAEDPAASVRLAAVERLGLAAQDPRVLEVIRRATQDANEDVRNAATAIVTPAPAASAKP